MIDVSLAIELESIFVGRVREVGVTMFRQISSILELSSAANYLYSDPGLKLTNTRPDLLAVAYASDAIREPDTRCPIRSTDRTKTSRPASEQVNFRAMAKPYRSLTPCPRSALFRFTAFG